MNFGRRRAQSGVVLLITLIAMVVLLISGVALVRSMDASQIQAGNMAFKRDLKIEADRAVTAATNLIQGGTVGIADSLNNNYSATRLATDSHGIPTVLVDDSAYSNAGMAAPDMVDSAMGVTLRYVIDRQCSAVGAASTDTCGTTEGVKKNSELDLAADNWQKEIKSGMSDSGGGIKTIYRITVRATGPRNTQMFIQSTVGL